MPLVIGVYIGSGFMALAQILRSGTIDGACHRQGAMTMRGDGEMGLRKGMAERVLGLETQGLGAPPQAAWPLIYIQMNAR
jgi:hypothetical protein